MSVVYNGAGSLVSATTGAGTRVGIFSSTNANPIVVSTISAHGFNTGDTVEIEGHATNTTANTLSQITVVDTKHFSLNGVAGVGVGGSTGYAINYELLPAVTLPAGGELLDPGVVGAFAEGLANTAPYLYRASGKYKLYNVYTASSLSFLGNITTSGTTNTSFATITNGTALLSFSTPAPVVQTNDYLKITLTGAVLSIASSATNDVAYAIGLSITGFAGGAYQQLSAVSGTGGQAMQFATSTVTNVNIAPITLVGTVVVPSLGTTVGATFNVGIGSALNAASPSTTVAFYGPWNLIVEHYRPN
jgi:hypothetical protein